MHKRMMIEQHKGRDLGPTAPRIVYLESTGPYTYKHIPPSKWHKSQLADETPQHVREQIAQLAWQAYTRNKPLSWLIDNKPRMSNPIANLTMFGMAYHGGDA